jgi:hypothetical protein
MPVLVLANMGKSQHVLHVTHRVNKDYERRLGDSVFSAVWKGRVKLQPSAIKAQCLTGTFGLQAKQIQAMPDCPPETRRFSFS